MPLPFQKIEFWQSALSAVKKREQEEIDCDFMNGLTSDDDVEEIVVKRAKVEHPVREDKDDDDDVVYICTKSASSTSKNQDENNNNSANECVLDEEISIVFARVTPSATHQYPHSRADCPMYKFEAMYGPLYQHIPSKPNKNFCNYCYCYVCDIEASKCDKWASDRRSHCNASSKHSLWRKERQYCKLTILNFLDRVHHTDAVMEAADRACAITSSLKVKFEKYRTGDERSQHCDCPCHQRWNWHSTRSDGCNECRPSHRVNIKIHLFSEIYSQILCNLTTLYSCLLSGKKDDAKAENVHKAAITLDAITFNILGESINTGQPVSPYNDIKIQQATEKLAQVWCKCMGLAEGTAAVTSKAIERLKEALSRTTWEKKYVQCLENVITSVASGTCTTARNLPKVIARYDTTSVRSLHEASKTFNHLSKTSPREALLFGASVRVNANGETLWNVPATVASVATLLAECGYLEQVAIYLELPSRLMTTLTLLSKIGSDFAWVRMSGGHVPADTCNYSHMAISDLKYILGILYQQWKKDGCKVDQTFVHIVRLTVRICTDKRTKGNTSHSVFLWMLDEFVCAGFKYYGSCSKANKADETKLKEWVYKIAEHKKLDFSIPSFNIDGNVLLILCIIHVSVHSWCDIYDRLAKILSTFNVKKLYWASSSFVKALYDANLNAGHAFHEEFINNTLPHLSYGSLPNVLYDKLVENLNVDCQMKLAMFFKKEAANVQEATAVMLKGKTVSLVTLIADKLSNKKHSELRTRTNLVKDLKNFSYLRDRTLKMKIDEVAFYYSLSYTSLIALRKHHTDSDWSMKFDMYMEHARQQITKYTGRCETIGKQWAMTMFDLFVRAHYFSCARQILEMYPYKKKEIVWSKVQTLLAEPNLQNKQSMGVYLGVVVAFVFKVMKDTSSIVAFEKVIKELLKILDAIPACCSSASVALVPAFDYMMIEMTKHYHCMLSTPMYSGCRKQIIDQLTKMKELYQACTHQPQKFSVELERMINVLQQNTALTRELKACFLRVEHQQVVSVTVHRSSQYNEADQRVCKVQPSQLAVATAEVEQKQKVPESSGADGRRTRQTSGSHYVSKSSSSLRQPRTRRT
ncbi:uncharacterized protein [Ptychodera flava]|uniref:uncharacterized protein isoform X2 n=1 Tax=Ptychodera flava TaxID=63121 RepID=UPI00396A13AD